MEDNKELLDACIHLATTLAHAEGLQSVSVVTRDGKNVDSIGRIDVKDLGFLIIDVCNFCLRTGEDLRLKQNIPKS